LLAHWLLLPPALLLGVSIARALGGWIVLAADRGEPARFGRQELAITLREAGARALMTALAPLGWTPAPPRVSGPIDDRRVPVLLVPGHRWNRQACAFLRTFLVHRGWGCVWAVSSVDRSIPEQARELGRRVEELIRATGAHRVDVVAHSTSGLAAAWYVQHLEGAATVRRLVTLGTPWAGTRVAAFLPGRRGVEMVYGSPILEGLTPPAVPTICVWSPDDPMVVPTSSAVPDGVEAVRIEGVGHVEMLTSARVYRAVQAALSP
jgi:triacylglycerol esterase/lipase EstA (alpha/beta hydrolase family)